MADPLAELAKVYLSQALGAKKLIAEDDPYLEAQGIPESLYGTIIQGAPKYGYSETGKAGLLTGLASGLLGGLSQDYQKRAEDSYLDVLGQSFSGQTPEKPDVLSPSLFADAQRQARIAGTTALFAQKGRENEIAQEGRESAKKQILQSYLENPAATIATLGKPTVEAALGIKIQEQPEVSSAEVLEKSAGPSLKPTIPYKSLEERKENLYRQNLRTMSPSRAAIEAENAIKRKVEFAKGDLKALDEEAEGIATIEKLVQDGYKGVEDAGVTGSFSPIRSGYERVLSTASDFVGGGVFPEAEKQAAGDTLLKATKNVAAAVNRIKGTGALSNFESKALFDTAPGPDKSKTENLLLLDRYSAGLKIAKEHQDFVRTMITDYGISAGEAQKLWNQYKADNPIIDSKGNVLPDSERTPWYEYDFMATRGEAKKGSNGESKYSVQDLIANGYSDRQIEQFKAQGLVR